MKKWAMKNLASLMSVIGAVIFAVIVIVVLFIVGLGVKGFDGALTYNDIKDSGMTAANLVKAALAFSIIAIIPVVIRLILGILGIDLFARIFNSVTIGLGLLAVILLIAANINLINIGEDIHVGSIIGFYILLVIGLFVITGPIVKK